MSSDRDHLVVEVVREALLRLVDSIRDQAAIAAEKGYDSLAEILREAAGKIEAEVSDGEG